MRVLILTRYGRLGASSRVRFLQYVPWLEEAAIQVTVQPLLSDALLRLRYARGAYPVWALVGAYVKRWATLQRREAYDLLWIEKEAFPWWPLWLEAALLRSVPYVLDYDDAVYLAYDANPRAWVRRLFAGRLGRLMAKSALVVGGNDYLANYARSNGAARVAVVPTVLDLARYPAHQRRSILDSSKLDRLRVVWIGSPATVHYLQLLAEPLRVLVREASFVLRVIGGGAVQLPGVPIELVPWSEDTEVEAIADCDIGVMPLVDSDWERGKCGYKLIQYMACSLPVVASGVGVNPEIVEPGVNGFLANSNQEWVAALRTLLGDPSLRSQMGLAGRQRVERDYCVQQTGPRMVTLLQSVGGAA
ncbi:glycosyltransferase family 4 protein [Rhodoferax sp.]|uniref:glycosyltransferase family 4 protein n=1 Tax=Rhodoferax sp. TaxID=50421 RepID=UPI0027785EDE|nr:glycosyltransferase family 4 protein [Rhodoferax sp.]